MREAALVPLPAIAGSEEAAPGDSGLLAREVVASAVGVAVARLGAVRLAAGLVIAVLGVGAAAVGGPLVVRARRGGEAFERESRTGVEPRWGCRALESGSCTFRTKIQGTRQLSD